MIYVGKIDGFQEANVIIFNYDNESSENEK